MKFYTLQPWWIANVVGNEYWYKEPIDIIHFEVGAQQMMVYYDELNDE